MASKDKPYRVYRGGRVKGPVPTESRKGEHRAPGVGDGQDAYARPEAEPAATAAPLAAHRLLIVLLVVRRSSSPSGRCSGYLAFRSGVKEANERLDSRAVRGARRHRTA